MKFDIWKASTLVFGGLLVLLVGQGSVRESAACDTIDEVSFEEQEREQSRARLSSALSLLTRAEEQIRLASAARREPRSRALEQISLAKSQVRSGFDTPRPRPRPMRSHNQNVVMSFD